MLTVNWAGAQNSQSPMEANGGAVMQRSLAPLSSRVHDKSFRESLSRVCVRAGYAAAVHQNACAGPAESIRGIQI
jgi:hypothetical protein